MEKAKKKRFGLIAAIVLALLIVLGVWGGLAKGASEAKHVDTFDRIKEQHRIVWGVKADTRLFGLMNTKTGEYEGFDVDIARAVTKQIAKDENIKLKAELVQVSSSSKIQLLKNANIDATASVMTITKERENQVDFTQPYFPAGQSLLVKENSDIRSVKDLNQPGRTVIGAVGTTAIPTMKEFAPKVRVLSLADYAQSMTALKAGQGDALTTDNAILYGLAQQNPGYKIVGGNFTNQPYGLATDNDQPRMIAAMNKALDELEKNGTYNRLIKKWFSNVPGLDWRTLQK